MSESAISGPPSAEEQAALARAARTRACSGADRERQAELYAACFKKPLAPGGLAWRYDRNPVGMSATFVCELPDGRAVSGYACNPRRALARGETSSMATVGETGDVMTHPQWRKFGLFSELDRAAMRHTANAGWPLVFGLPNRRSAHIFTQDLGWESIGKVREWSFVLSADGRARRARAADGRLAAWGSALDRWRGARKRKRLEQRGKGLKIAPLERFPEEVVELSRAVEARFEFMVRRDAEYLNWRFVDAPSRQHRVLGAFDGGNKLVGYAVIQSSGHSGVGYLVDLLAPSDAARDGLIAAALGALGSSGASLVRATAIDGSWWSLVLAQSGFVPARADNHLVVILYVHQVDHRLSKAAADASRWYFTDGDRDDETMG